MSVALARCYIGRQSSKLHIEPHCQGMGKKAMLLGRDMRQDWTFLPRASNVRSLLCWLRLPNIYFYFFTQGNYFGYFCKV